MINIATAETVETDLIKFGKDVSDIFTTPEMLNEQDFSFLNNKEDPRFKMVVKAIAATAFNQNVNNMFYKQLIVLCETVLKQIEQELK